MLPFSLYLALKYLKPKRSFVSVVTVISILGVLLGVSILVIVLSVMTGFDNMWRTKILSFKPHLTITSRYGVIEDEEELCRRVETIEGVTGVAPSVETRVMIQHRGRMAAPVVLGVDPNRAGLVSRIPDHISSGRFDLDEDTTVVGCDLALQLGLSPGDKLLVHSPLNIMSQDEIHLPEELEVVGIFDMGMRDFDSGFILASIHVVRDVVGLDAGAYTVYVMTEDPFRFEEYAARVKDALGPTYDVRAWQEVDRVLFDALSHEKTMMFVLLAFITVVAIFCVTVTLIVVVVQKTSEIGLLKALGIPTWKILLAFLIHGWVQCLIGTLAGIGTGLLILSNIPRIVAALAHCNVSVFPKAIYGLSEIPWETSARDLVQICVMVLVVCTLTCVIPVLRAALLEPVEAFRQE